VQTPAGRFEACYRLVFSANTGQEQDWFCPGVGRARREYHHNGTRLDEVWELKVVFIVRKENDEVVGILKSRQPGL
jgi:hypothetical protein